MKKFFVITLIFSSAALLTGCSLPQSVTDQLATITSSGDNSEEVIMENTATSSASSEAKSTVTINGQTKTEHELTLTATEDGQTALELLETNAEVKLKAYDFGSFVEGINGTLANNENYWAFYVNDEYAQAGAGETILNAGDIVTFRYEKLNQ